MAHSKKANAMVVHPYVSRRQWSRTRTAATSGASNRNLTDQAREILGGSLDPDKYLFTHCTIVASVDTEQAPNAKLGRVRVGSRTIDRRWGDFYITDKSAQFVNNNGDCWSRPVLTASYPTFIAGHNFQEHVQIEAQSKGRILDAVARDIGDSVYIDILVATDRKHETLVRDIRAGVMGTLSMGCTTDFTICSQCGHVAVDETDLCDHIKISKLNSFLDERQQKRVVAELCGHIDYKDNPDAPGGVNFIEASWVKVPAFPGAVMRNLIDAGDLPPAQVKKALRDVLAQAPTGWSDTAMSKAANLTLPKFCKAFDFEDDDEEGGDAPKGEEPKKPFEDLTEKVYEKVKDKVHDRIDEDLREDEASEADSEVTFQPNDSIQREAGARLARKAYHVSMDLLTRTASSQVALVEGVATLNQAYGIPTDPAPYRVALKVGSPVRYTSPQDYKRAILRAAGRELSSAELRVVVRVGSLLSKWERNNNPQTL